MCLRRGQRPKGHVVTWMSRVHALASTNDQLAILRGPGAGPAAYLLPHTELRTIHWLPPGPLSYCCPVSEAFQDMLRAKGLHSRLPPPSYS